MTLQFDDASEDHHAVLPTSSEECAGKEFLALILVRKGVGGMQYC